MRETFDQYVDLGSPSVKARLRAFIERATGWHRLTLKPARVTRSQQQNRAWHGLVVAPLAKFILSQADEPIDPEDAHDAAHDMLARHCLGVVKVYNPLTGEVEERRKPTSRATVEEFSAMWDRACLRLAEIGIIVSDPVQSAPSRPVERAQRPVKLGPAGRN